MLFWTIVQISAEGRIEVEQIYANATGEHGGHNPSAFITTHIEKARRLMFPEGAAYKDMPNRY